MAFNDTFNRLERLAYLIHLKATGNPKELAKKLGVCPRTVDNLINSLRYLGGVDIYYCKSRGSYCFEKPVKICFDLIIPLEDYRKTTGGKIFLQGMQFFCDEDLLIEGRNNRGTSKTGLLNRVDIYSATVSE